MSISRFLNIIWTIYGLNNDQGHSISSKIRRYYSYSLSLLLIVSCMSFLLGFLIFIFRSISPLNRRRYLTLLLYMLLLLMISFTSIASLIQSTGRNFKNFPQFISHIENDASILGQRNNKIYKRLTNIALLLHLSMFFFVILQCITTFKRSLIERLMMSGIFMTTELLSIFLPIKFVIEAYVEAYHLNVLNENLSGFLNKKYFRNSSIGLNDISRTFMDTFECIRISKTTVFFPVYLFGIFDVRLNE
jgi:hypothetical protein